MFARSSQDTRPSTESQWQRRAPRVRPGPAGSTSPVRCLGKNHKNCPSGPPTETFLRKWSTLCKPSVEILDLIKIYEQYKYSLIGFLAQTEKVLSFFLCKCEFGDQKTKLSQIGRIKISIPASQNQVSKQERVPLGTIKHSVHVNRASLTQIQLNKENEMDDAFSHDFEKQTHNWDVLTGFRIGLSILVVNYWWKTTLC